MTELVALASHWTPALSMSSTRAPTDAPAESGWKGSAACPSAVGAIPSGKEISPVAELTLKSWLGMTSANVPGRTTTYDPPSLVAVTESTMPMSPSG